MKNRKIVRRIFTIDNGEKCDKTMYLASPKDMIGSEYWNNDIEKAHLFKNDVNFKNSSYNECVVNGTNRYGIFSYKQEILDIELSIKTKN